VEFRALETLPQVEWSSAIALLWSSLAAHLLERAHRPRALRDWGPELHDRMLLPSQLWADLEAILAELADDGLALDPTPYRQIWEWRFPPLLEWRQGDDWVVLQPAPEPWPLICDTPVQGGFTSRFIDGSLRRIEISVSDSFRQHGSLRLNGRPLPLGEAPLAVRYRHQRLYPCLHPAIAPQLPLALELITPAGHSRFQLEEQDLTFLPLPAGSEPQPTPGAAAWSGRQRPGDLTIDLRLD